MPYLNGSFDDYDGTEVFTSIQFYPNGTISENDNSVDLDPFSYVYHYKDTHAFFWNLDNEYLFDETGESCTNLWASYFGVDIPFSIDIPDVVKNGVAWEEKYTGNVAGANYSVEFYIDGADVTAKLYNEGVYASTMEDILLGRMLINGQKILGMVDQTTGNMIMFSADASSCTMTDSAGNVMGTLTLE